MQGKNETSVNGICKLCGNSTEYLRESHILPKFVFRWLKNTSATGYLRFGEHPNRRVQDGLKFYWLCEQCEGLLNTYETTFANTIFYPYNTGNLARVSYDEWLIKFCVSVSWRVLLVYTEEVPALSEYSEQHIRYVERALTRWKQYLLGQVVHPGQYEQHLLPFDAIQSHTLSEIPTNINRYILRSTDMDLVKGGDTIYVYSKLGRFVIIGFVNMPYPRQWVGTKVHLKHGILEPTEYTIPEAFGEYFMGKAKRASEIQGTIRGTQQEKIRKSYRKDLDKAAKSETMQAMHYDFEMFGDKAFRKDSEE